MKKMVQQTHRKKKKDRRFGDHFVDFYNSSLSYGRKKRCRIRYLNWATELLGHSDPEVEKKLITELSQEERSSVIDDGDPSGEETTQKVREAVGNLTPLERQFIEYFYFECKSYQEISLILNKKVHKLERIHNRALGKLKMLLSDYVKTRFKLKLPEDLKMRSHCIICKSPFRQELDELIRGKKDEETYKPLMRVFKEKYGLEIKTPQGIIGHKKKHMV
ncbi:MAG: RNA polymerase sigma factor [Candidatus Zixiibacteriota bacterium]